MLFASVLLSESQSAEVVDSEMVKVPVVSAVPPPFTCVSKNSRPVMVIGPLNKLFVYTCWYSPLKLPPNGNVLATPLSAGSPTTIVLALHRDAALITSDRM